VDAPVARWIEPSVLAGQLHVPGAREDLSVVGGVAAVVVDGRGAGGLAVLAEPAVATVLESLPTVTVALVPPGTDRMGAEPFDVVLPDGPWPVDEAVAAVVASCERSPHGALAMAHLLRSGCWSRGDDEGLWAESITYGALQGSAAFHAWLGSERHLPRAADAPGPPLLVREVDGATHLVLHRPHVRNALDVTLRDALCEALDALALGDGPIVLEAAGPSFSAGGDLLEFGTTRDPGLTHALRSTRLPARALARVAHRVTARVQGAAVGAGIELAAWCARVEADPGMFALLPEVPMGLVPGAGGTVSVPRRVGRQRAALLALSGLRLPAADCLEWGLVDAIVPVQPAAGV
jgi:enoyl-CoA hydratase